VTKSWRTTAIRQSSARVRIKASHMIQGVFKRMNRKERREGKAKNLFLLSLESAKQAWQFLLTEMC